MLEINSEVLFSWIQGLVLPLVRILGFIAVSPFFSEPAIPGSIKLGTGLILTLAALSSVAQPVNIDLVSIQGILTIFIELVIGITIGFILKLVFSIIDFTGQFMGLMMGFGFASFYDMRSGSSSTTVNILLNTLAMLIFISINGHLLVLSLLVESLNTLPASSSMKSLNYDVLIKLVSNIFSVGLKIALPVAAILLLVNSSMAILSRAAPQLNLFVIGFPLTVGIGLFTLYFILEALSIEFQHQIAESLIYFKQIFLQ